MDFFLHERQEAWRDEDVVEESPQPTVIICALGAAQFLALLRHEGCHALPDASEDIVGGLGVEVAHQQDALPPQFIEQGAQGGDCKPAVRFAFLPAA